MLTYWARARTAKLGPRMHDDRDRDDRKYWSSTKPHEGLVVEIGPAETRLARGVTQPNSDSARRRAAPSAAGSVRDEDSLQHVGRRGRFRPELALVVVAAVFLAGALVKPWSTPGPANSASPTGAASSSSVIAAVPSAELTAEPPAATYPNLPPSDYRFPFFGPSASSALGGQPGASTAPTPQWSVVDWSTLGVSDPHPGWGFTAVLMPSPDANVGSPTTNWVSAGSPPVYASVPLAQGRYAYAIAVTWPKDVNVKSLRFVYLAPPRSPPYVPPAGFQPNAQVTPLPADRVSSSLVGPTASPTVPPWFGSVGGAIQSGAYWIPPSEASPTATTGPLFDAWKSDPWPWPYGSYLVTVTSDSGSMNIVLDLLLTF
jgi:hypothetical protein